MKALHVKFVAVAVLVSLAPLSAPAASKAEKGVKRLLYVTAPDGAMRKRAKPGVYVYDIDNGHKLVKHISIPDMGGTRGCAASAAAGKLYISHKNTYMMCFDIVSEKKVWEISYPKSDGGFDRTCITPDGKKLYVPEGWWSHTANSMAVLDGETGKLISKIDLGVDGGHNSIMSPSGKRMYLGSVRSGHIFVVDTATDKIIKRFGPFGKDPTGKRGRVSPYCINGAETLCFVNSHDVGFYVGDLVNQKVLHWVQAKDARGFSHGVGMTPDEKELWLPNPSDKRILIYDATVMPPKRTGSIDVRSKSHGWVTFSLDGKYAWPDTGEVIDAKTKKVVATLKGIDGKGVIMSSKFIEIHFKDGKLIKVGDQFGIGRVVPKAKSKLKSEGTSTVADEQDGVDFRVDIFQRGKNGYHTYRIPTMVVTAKGTILLFCEGRVDGRRDMGNVDQLMKRSTDGGKTWSRQVVLLDEGKGRVGNPCPIIEADGKTVHLLFTRHVGECMFHIKSTDEGKTWSKPMTYSATPGQKEYDKNSFLHKLGDPPVKLAIGPVHGIQTKKGRLIAPCYGGWMKDGKRRGGSFIIYSDDLGKTWNAGGVIPFVEDLRTGECTILERPDGSLMMNLRTSAPGLYGLGHRGVSISTDRGMTWSKPVLDKSLPSTGCQGSIIRLNDKEILFLNPAIHRKGGFSIRSRRNLTLRMSKDEGKTWPCARVLNKALSGYSDMAITKEGKILCLFENGIRDYCDKITIVQVDPKWLAAGKVSEKEGS